MHYVYLIRSIHFPEIFYVGYTTNLEQRLKTHNKGGSTFTQEFRPWEAVVILYFVDEKKAKEFERYLKTQSGRAFAKKRFW